MKTCNRCHSENFDDIKFCNFCGYRLPLRRDLGFSGSDAPYAVGTAVAQPAPAKAGNPRQAYALFLKGRKLLAVGDVEAAIVVFQQALEADPGDPQIRQLLKRAVRMRSAAARRGAVPRHEAPQGKISAVLTPAEPIPERLQDDPAPAVTDRNRPSRNVFEASLPIPARDDAPAQTRGSARERFFETLQPSLQYRPSTLMDQADSSIWREVAVTALIVFGVFAFGYLLVF